MSSDSTQSRAALARDAALARVGRTRRWVIVGAAALTAGFAALVSAAAPGRSLASKPATRTEVSTGSSSAVPQLPPVASPSTLGLQGPTQPPKAVPSPSSPTPQSSPGPQSSGGSSGGSSGAGSGGGVVSGGS